MSDGPQSSLAPTTATPPAALETHETTQAKDDMLYSPETASPLCNETAHDVSNECTTAVDHPVHRHANKGGDHSASEQAISESVVSEVKWTVSLTVGHCVFLEPILYCLMARAYLHNKDALEPTI